MTEGRSFETRLTLLTRSSIGRQMPNGQSVPNTSNGRLVLTTLGRAVLEFVDDSGERREVLPSGKPLGLFVYLACFSARSTSREHLMDLLWADLDIEAARHSVRQAVWYLRQRLGETVVLTSEGKVSLSAVVDSDHNAFLEAIERVDFERAVELYRGDFLPGFAAPGGAEFEQWADLERLRLRRLFRRAGEALVRDWMTKGRLRKAKELAIRLRDAAPEAESSSRLVLETLLAANDRVGAELEAQRLEETIARAERPPEPATASLLALIRQTSPEFSTPTKQTLTAELIGRETEFAAILTAWDTARGGTGQHVHVTSPAGLGKTRLLGEVQARLRASSARAVLVRANAGERHIPYAFASELSACLAALPGSAAISPASAGALVALNPSLSARYAVPADHAGDLEALRRRETALIELLLTVAEEQPVAVLMDDVHWSDSLSRQLVQGVVGKLIGRRILIVTCARPGPEGEPTSSGIRLVLRPLSPEETGALLVSLGRLPDESWAVRLPMALHRATRGSPLLILETLHLVIELDCLALNEGSWFSPDPTALETELAKGAALVRRIRELERAPTWLLLVLATAGAPLSAHVLARAADRDVEAVQSDLQALDLRGLATHDGTEWQAAHDEIAARALELATPDARRAANAALGRQLAALGRDDPGMLHRAGRHLANAGEDRELRRVFRRRVFLQRRWGERRPARALATDLLGNGAAPARIHRLVRSLPIYVRLGLVTPRRIAMAAASALAMGAAAAAWMLHSAPPPPDINLVVIRPGRDSLEAHVVPIRREGWEAGTTIDLQRLATPNPALSAAQNDLMSWVPRYDGGAWAFAKLSGDSGDIDLFMTSPTGAIRRLTFFPGDDYNPSWSPDGRALVFATTRGNADRYAHLALLELATGRITELTHGEPGDGAPHWSPDGARIGYTHSARDSRGGGPGHICIVTLDGRTQTCSYPPFYGLLGWYDADQLLLSMDSGGAHRTVRLNLSTGNRVILDDVWNGASVFSPDAQWVACWCTRSGLARADWYVYPSDRPDQARRVVFGADSSDRLTLRWLPAAIRPSYLDRLEISAGFDTAAVGADDQLAVRGFDSNGSPIPLTTLSWRSDDPSIASVGESSGMVRAQRLGTVTIRASAGGWREAAFALAVVTPPPTRTVFQEDWSGSIETQWVPFGDPWPETTEGPERKRAFWNKGEGWYNSGVYSRRRISAQGGLGVEAQFSTPVTGPRQQFIRLHLASNLDSAALAQWDHRTGPLPQVGVLARECDFQYAPGDVFLKPPATIWGGDTLPLPKWVDSGKWYSVVAQIFPDGRCGVAVEGKPLMISHTTIPPSDRYWVVVDGNSVGNRMLVGPLRVWTGVRSDLDWAALNRRVTSRPAPPPPSSRLAASPTGSPQSAQRPRTPRPRP